AGVGKVKGFEVVVADAAKLVGKKVKVRVVAVTEGMAFAVQGSVADESQPITAEAEAEKPTRAKRPAKTTETAEAEVEAGGGTGGGRGAPRTRARRGGGTPPPRSRGRPPRGRRKGWPGPTSGRGGAPARAGPPLR